jgi:hypothetical protein
MSTFMAKPFWVACFLDTCGCIMAANKTSTVTDSEECALVRQAIVATWTCPGMRCVPYVANSSTALVQKRTPTAMRGF